MNNGAMQLLRQISERLPPAIHPPPTFFCSVLEASE